MFGRKKKEQLKRNKIFEKIVTFITATKVLGAFFIYRYPGQWKKYIKAEKRELDEFSSGQECGRRFLCNSKDALIDAFIPHAGNCFKPRALRPKNIFYYALTAVTIKLIVIGFLFLTYPTPAELSAIITSNMIALTNQARVAEGVAPLKENALLDHYAELKGQDMITRDYFAHDTPEGKRPWEWIDKGAYEYVYAGENLAMDFTSAESVQEAFMKSPSHKRNILNASYQDVGMAVLSGNIDGHETILLVEFFGTQKKNIASDSLVKETQPKSESVPKTEVAKKSETPKPKTAGASDVEPISPTIPPVAGPDINNEANQQAPVATPPAYAKPVAAEADVVNDAVQQPSVQTPLAYGVSNGNPVMALNDNQPFTVTDYIIEYSNIFFIGFLIFMIISLGLNVFVKIHVQHPSMILQSVALIALLLAFVVFKFNFIGDVPDHILIL